MPVADILKLGQGAATNQTIADLMLIEDRAMRAALKRDDAASALRHMVERDKLAEQLK